MKYVEIIGKTKEEAVQEALRQLGATMDQVTIESDEQKSKGIFGFLAKTEYRVKVTLKEQEAEIKEDAKQMPISSEETVVSSVSNQVLENRAKQFLLEIFQSIGIEDIEINTSTEEDNIVLRVFGEDASRLIGRRGESLDSLQLLTNLAVNKGEESYKRVLLDIENYRAKREESLRKYANKMARQATKQKRVLKLEPMNPYERRIVHSALQSDRYVKTYSEGKDPYRKVVIEPKYRY